ncbi:MAG: hypothetical protein ACRYFS_16820 [Janthinobacterium lividum]
MRHIQLMLVALLTFLPLIVLADPAVPITLTASLDKSVYRTGNPIVLEVDLHNRGTDTVSLGGAAFDRFAFHFLITNAVGRPISRSVLGDRIFASPAVVHWNPLIVLKPGATRRYRYDLAALYSLSQTGVYILRVSRGPSPYSPRRGYTVSAGPLTIRIDRTTRNSPVTPFAHDPSADQNIP